jgi:hypothetical protein
LYGLVLPLYGRNGRMESEKKITLAIKLI